MGIHTVKSEQPDGLLTGRCSRRAASGSGSCEARVPLAAERHYGADPRPSRRVRSDRYELEPFHFPHTAEAA